MSTRNMIQAINDGLRCAMEKDDSIVVAGEDVGYFGGVFRATHGLQQTFGKTRVFDTPISENGIIGTDVGYLIESMRGLLDDPGEARRLGEAGRRTVQKRFGLGRFAEDWEDAFRGAVALREEVPCASR